MKVKLSEIKFGDVIKKNKEKFFVIRVFPGIYQGNISLCLLGPNGHSVLEAYKDTIFNRVNKCKTNQ